MKSIKESFNINSLSISLYDRFRRDLYISFEDCLYDTNTKTVPKTVIKTVPNTVLKIVFKIVSKTVSNTVKDNISDNIEGSSE